MYSRIELFWFQEYKRCSVHIHTVTNAQSTPRQLGTNPHPGTTGTWCSRAQLPTCNIP